MTTEQKLREALQTAVTMFENAGLGGLVQEFREALTLPTTEPVEDEAPPEGKRWFYCTTSVNSAAGWQQWRVAAEDLEEAKLIFAKEGGEFVDEELEVQDFDAPEWEDEK